MWTDSQDCPKMALSDYPRLAGASFLKLGATAYTSAGRRQLFAISESHEIGTFLFSDGGEWEGGGSGGGGGRGVVTVSYGLLRSLGIGKLAFPVIHINSWHRSSDYMYV